MEYENPFEPPQSAFEPAEPMPFAPVEEAHYFTTSPLKLGLMSLCTLGLYELYWFYKNWVLIKQRTGHPIMPFWRAFFAPLWAYSCFKHMKTSAEEHGIHDSLGVGFLAIMYFLVSATWRLPDPIWLITMFSFVALIPANNLAARVNQHVGVDISKNDGFSGWNWFGLLVGGFFLVLVIIGTFLPDA